MLLKFDNNPKVVKIVKTQAQVKPKQVETVTDVKSMTSYCSIEFGRQKTIPSCGDNLNLSIVKKSVVQKQEDVQEEDVHDVREVRVIQKQEDEKYVLEQITAAQTIPFSSKESSPTNLKRLLSQQFVPSPGQLQLSDENFCDLPMERTECDDITDVPPMGLLRRF